MVIANNSSEKVLVTGASGYLASHCIEQLLKAGYQVRGTVRSVKNAEKIKPLRDLPFAAERLELVEADLDHQLNWSSAVKGCDFVLHTASPLPPPLEADESIIPTAVNGALNVLQACVKEPSVKKVVLTSSCVAIDEGQQNDHIFTEMNWSPEDPKKVGAYARSKVAAEKAAWNFVENFRNSDNKFAFTTINPGFIVGPMLIDTPGMSVSAIRDLVTGKMPAVPMINFPIVDVRDVAKAHILAMKNSASDGERIMAVSEVVWMREITQYLAKEFTSQGYKVTKCEMPNFILNVVAIFNSDVKQVVPKLGQEYKYNTTKANRLLGMTFIPIEKSLIDMVYAMINRGLLPKPKKPQGRSSN